MLKTYLLTGASGFLGKHIYQALTAADHPVVTLGRSLGNEIICNLSTDVSAILQPVDTVVHAAGKAHVVPKTKAEKQDFFDVNLTGTKNLCFGLERLAVLPKAFIFISTVAVYGVDKGENINEQHPLQGSSPYAKSKMEAEAFLQKWCARHNIKLSILRLPLVAGPNPPGNLGAMIKGIKTGRYFNIGGGLAKKSMVMAGDVAAAIPAIAETEGIYNLTDGQHPSFAQLAAIISKQLNKPVPKNIPFWLAKSMAIAGDVLGNKAPINTDKLRKITATLTFDDSLARHSFGWNPNPVLEFFKIS